MLQVAFYDTKPYDREFFRRAVGDAPIKLHWHEFRLSLETASSAEGMKAVCVFVNDRLDAGVLARLKAAGAELLALRCAGFNHVDLQVARSLDLRVVRVPAYSPHAVAEHAVALLLTLNRRIHRAYNRVREHNFSLAGLVGLDLHGKTVGVVGTGKIGRIFAQIMKGFGCRVLATDPQVEKGWALDQGVELTDLQTLLRESDIVSLHLPLLPETHHLMNEDSLCSMKPGAILVNTSRGKLVDTSALICHLKSGRLGGVALDVYEEEERLFFEDLSGQVLQDDELSRLLTFPNVLVTAHQAFLTREALGEIARVTVRNMLAHISGESFLEGTELKG